MKLITRIDRHEVLRRWAIGETHSQFFNPTFESTRLETLEMLTSGNLFLERQGIDIVLEVKKGLIDSISTHINWYRAYLELNKSELDLVYTLQLPGWSRNTNGSFMIADAARKIYNTPQLDKRVTNIYKALQSKSAELDGITLLAVDKIGPYVVVEGTGRLTGLYIAQHLLKSHLIENNQIEVTIGLY